MIRFIAAIDEKKGLANNHGIPWQGKIPTDVKWFREKTLGGTVMMGYGWYQEQQKPLPDRRNVVAVPPDIEPLRPGFEGTEDPVQFLKDFKEDIWVGGGALLFASTIHLADELYLTKLDGDFGCTKFFPDYEDDFELTDESEEHEENGIKFRFTVWKRK